jgi:AcrR family transcriptional regulator
VREKERQIIIAALRDVQNQEYLSLRGLAYRLGVSPAYLSMVFTGKRRVGLRLLQAAIERYPQIRHMLAHSLSDECDDKPSSRCG